MKAFVVYFFVLSFSFPSFGMQYSPEDRESQLVKDCQDDNNCQNAIALFINCSVMFSKECIPKIHDLSDAIKSCSPYGIPYMPSAKADPDFCNAKRAILPLVIAGSLQHLKDILPREKNYDLRAICLELFNLISFKIVDKAVLRKIGSLPKNSRPPGPIIEVEKICKDSGYALYPVDPKASTKKENRKKAAEKDKAPATP